MPTCKNCNEDHNPVENLFAALDSEVSSAILRFNDNSNGISAAALFISTEGTEAMIIPTTIPLDSVIAAFKDGLARLEKYSALLTAAGKQGH